MENKRLCDPDYSHPYGQDPRRLFRYRISGAFLLRSAVAYTLSSLINHHTFCATQHRVLVGLVGIEPTKL